VSTIAGDPPTAYAWSVTNGVVFSGGLGPSAEIRVTGPAVASCIVTNACGSTLVNFNITPLSADAINDNQGSRTIATDNNLNVYANDTLCNGGTVTFSLSTGSEVNVTVPSFSSLGVALYRPTAMGPFSFTYNIFCNGLLMDTAMVNGTGVAGTTAIDDIYVTQKNVSISGNVATNDAACSSGSSFFEIISGTMAGGTVTMSQNGAFTFNPTPGSLSPGVFRYNLRCGATFVTSAIVASATVIVRVIGANIMPDNFTTTVNRAVVGLVGLNDIVSC
jgi:hypothetical protein